MAPTAVVVRVDTNLQPGTALTQLRIAAQFDGQADAFRDQPYPLVGDAGTRLPGTLLLLPENPGDTRVFTITVTGTVAGDSRPIVQRARLAFEYQHVLVIDMFLARECIGAEESGLCPADQTCTINEAHSGPRCISTQRAPMDYDAGGATGDASDLGVTDAGTDVVDDLASDARIDAPPTDAGLTPDPSLVSPRAIAPLSTTTAGTQRPTLRWLLAGSDGALVTLCRDAALTSGCVSQSVATGTSFRPARPLAPGAWHWNLRGLTGTRVSTMASPTWEFFVPAGGGLIDEGFVRGVDFDADGFADLAIGAPGTSSNMGAVSVSYGGIGAPAPGPDFVGRAPNERFGSAISGAGDVNGDGYGDLVIGSLQPYIIEGGARGSLRMYFLPSPFAVTTAVASVAGIGDVNGDGYGDVAVGGPTEATGVGAFAIFLGSATGVPTAPLIVRPGTTGSLYGSSIAALGDIDGDRLADFAVSGPGYFMNTGRIDVYLARDLTTPVSFTHPGPFGRAIAAGDINGDGRIDLLAMDTSAGAGTFGSAVQLYRGTGGTERFAHDAMNSTVELTNGVADLAVVGDLDGDGFDDAIAGQPGAAAFPPTVIFGSATGIDAMHAIGLTGGSPDTGHGVGCLGDLNGDGYPEFAIGSAGIDQAFLLYGGPGLRAWMLSTPINGTAGTRFGEALAAFAPRANCTLRRIGSNG